MEWLNLLSPILLFTGTVIGFLFGRRKQNVEIDSIAVASSKVAVETLLATIDPLKEEIRQLKSEVEALKELNEMLVTENKQLSESIKQFKRYLAETDDWKPFFADPPKWGGPYKS